MQQSTNQIDENVDKKFKKISTFIEVASKEA